MSKKIIAGALGVAMAVGSFAVLAVPAFGAFEGWQQVTVTPDTELVLGGSYAPNTVLGPTISANDSEPAGNMTIKSTVAWQLDWQAVTGAVGTASDTGAPGTNLGSTGFANAGGYTYNGATAATAGSGNTWGASIASSGGTVEVSYGLTTGLTTIVKGAATSSATVTPTYAASTDGTLSTATYYGTIYYVLAAQ